MKTKPKKNRKQLPFSYHLGNLIIAVVLLSLFITFWPILEIYLFPPKIKPAAQVKETSITIPRINAQAPLILDVDPWNETVYKTALTKGVAHAKDTSFPWEEGKSFLFAHSSGNPWELTSYNTVFLRLGELMVGDEVLITQKGKVYRFVVEEKKTVWPSEVSYLESSNENQLVIMTCTPIGTSLKRLLIFAKPTN
jgi:sortase A